MLEKKILKICNRDNIPIFKRFKGGKPFIMAWEI